MSQPRYGRRQSLELSFVTALQALAPRERAALLLRDVVGLTGAEVGEVLEAAPGDVEVLVARARRTLEARLPERSQQAILETLGPGPVARVAAGYARAWTAGDPGALRHLLADGVVLTLAGIPPVLGRDAALAALASGPLRPGVRWRVLPAHVSAQLAFAALPRNGNLAARTVHVVCLDGAGLISALVLVRDLAPARRAAP